MGKGSKLQEEPHDNGNGINLFANQCLAYREDLFSFAMRLTKKNAADAEDLLSDTILAALKNKDRFTPGTNLKAWLYTIMINKHINNWRKQKPFPVPPASLIMAEKINIKQRVTQPYINNSFGNALIDLGRSMLAKGSSSIQDLEKFAEYFILTECDDDFLAIYHNLEPQFRHVFILIDIFGLSYEETAKILKIPEGTTMSRLYRARDYFRQDSKLADRVCREYELRLKKASATSCHGN